MKAGSLCTGIGGLDLAVEAHFGAELAWHAEIEPAPCTVLEREWPDVPNLRDLTTVDWVDVEPVDVLSAGYPCQPFSHAGKRQGAKDERHLWPHIAEAVRVLRPRWVVLENVAGHLTLGFGDVLRDLAEAGFDAEWCVLRASDVGAPHQRARLFVVARDADRSSEDPYTPAGAPRTTAGERHCPTADPDDRRRLRRRTIDSATTGAGGQGRQRGAARAGADPATDTADIGHERTRLTRGRRTGLTNRGDAPANTDRERLPRRPQHDGEPQAWRLTERAARDDADRLGVAPVAWGPYEPAIRQWEHALGRPAPHPTDERGRLSPTFVEWMQGYPEGWVADLTRTQALKALGNAVVPQQGFAALCELVPAHLEERAA